MTRQKIEMKKIINTSARHVTFSKRKKGLFKKAHDIATLCDSEICVIIFSGFGKLYDFSSSSIHGIIEKRNDAKKACNMQINEPLNMDLPSLELQSAMCPKLCKEVVEKTNEIRHMKGQDLQDLGIEELKRLEDAILNGLTRVLKLKCKKVMEDNKLLKKYLMSAAT